MESYINNYDNYNVKMVYNFDLGSGGIGDCIKFFMYALTLSIKHNIKLFYQINNIPIEKYLKLKNEKMYISPDTVNDCKDNIIHFDDIKNIQNNKYNIITPFLFYEDFNYDKINLKVDDVFVFSDEVILNSHRILPRDLKTYISIHLRLGDKHLETDSTFVNCKDDVRVFNETILFSCIEKNYEKNILFFCDNLKYKLKIKDKYNNIIITNSDIGHSGLLNTTEKQTFDAITDFYLMTESECIYSASYSGFSEIAVRFKNINIHRLYG